MPRAADAHGLPERSFYSSWRLGEVERCVLRLLSAARKKAAGGAAVTFRVCFMLTLH